MKEIAILACLLAPTSFIAVVAWWYNPRLWWASIGALASAAGIVLYLPTRAAFHAPWREFDGFGLAAEFIVIGGFFGVVHLVSLGAIALMLFEKFLERRKAARKIGGTINEVPSND